MYLFFAAQKDFSRSVLVCASQRLVPKARPRVIADRGRHADEGATVVLGWHRHATRSATRGGGFTRFPRSAADGHLRFAGRTVLRRGRLRTEANNYSSSLNRRDT